MSEIDCEYCRDPTIECPHQSQDIGRKFDSGNPDFDSLLAEMATIHKAKNHDYSNPEDKDYYSNFRECEELGIEAWRGIIVRMSDKWKRIKRLSQRDAAVKDETIEDTLIDLANYSLLCILVRRLWKELEDKKDGC